MRLIDADALKKRMVNEPVKAVNGVDFQAEWFTRIADTVCQMIDMVDDAPTIDAVPVRHGEWKYNPKDAIEMMFALPKCSICGHESSDALNYCPNCGARMGERREE